MAYTRVFDVLIVYSEYIAGSAGESSCQLGPFPREDEHSAYNLAYAYLLSTCQKMGLRAAFSTTADIVGPGRCSSYWTSEGKVWQKHNEAAFAPQIFDKFSLISEKLKRERVKLFSSPKVKPFNDPELANLFLDKYKTFERLEYFALPTVELDKRTREGVEEAVAQLWRMNENHLNPGDLTHNIVVKDRRGSGGDKIYRVTENYVEKIEEILAENRGIDFILQPYLDFEQGFIYKGIAAATDIRLIYQNGQIFQSYIRRAKPGDFRCNCHQGGSLEDISLAELPSKVIAAAESVNEALGKPKALYTLDFIVSNAGNVYLLEGNINPGVNWDLTSKVDERKSKELIREIAREIARRRAISQASVGLGIAVNDLEFLVASNGL